MYKSLLTVFLACAAWLASLEPIIILTGPPGSGKGTFAQHFTHHHNYNHISAGDLVRQEILKGTPIGIEIEETVQRGDFIPRQIMHALISSKIEEFVFTEKPLIIDGFVRSYEDGLFLNETLTRLNLLDRTFEIILETDDTTCQERIFCRQVCSNCNYVYNTKTVPSNEKDICSLCKHPLICRINDTPAIIMKRIKGYRAMMGMHHMCKIAGLPSLEIITDRPLKSCLGSYSQLAQQIEAFDGNAAGFLMLFQGVKKKDKMASLTHSTKSEQDMCNF